MSKLEIILDGQRFEIEIDALPESDAEAGVRVNGVPVRVRVPPARDARAEPEWLVIDDRPYEILMDRAFKYLSARGQTYALQVRDLETPTARPVSGDGRVTAPIPGVITEILVDVGDAVSLGQPLLLLEAMKMENQVRAPRGGIVATLHVRAGEGVVLGQMLAEIT